MKTPHKLLLAIAMLTITALGYFFNHLGLHQKPTSTQQPTINTKNTPLESDSNNPADITEANNDKADAKLLEAIRYHSKNFHTQSVGTIVKALPDDTKGDRHQKILIEIAGHHRILIIHNTDLAPRVKNLVVGEQIAFNGVYIWNYKGGIIHWTHHDPRGQHQNGWLKYQGKLYQ